MLYRYPEAPKDVAIYARDPEHICGLVRSFQQKALLGFPLRDEFMSYRPADCVSVEKGTMDFNWHPDGSAIEPAQLTTFSCADFSVRLCLDDRDYLRSLFRGFRARRREELFKYESHPHCAKDLNVTTLVPRDIAEMLAELDLPLSDRYLRAIGVIRR
jgi:hypothetical protein